MADQYKWGLNPFNDSLLEIMIRGGDIAANNNRDAIIDIFKYILQLYLINKKDIIYLDFEIKDKKGYCSIIGNNIISALWLSGVIPANSLKVMESNEFSSHEYKYTFDNIKKNLKCEII